MENSRKDGKQYTWLSGPKARSKSDLQRDGQIASYCFNVINLAARETKMNLVVDFPKQTLILKEPNVRIFDCLHKNEPIYCLGKNPYDDRCKQGQEFRNSARRNAGRKHII